MDDTLHEYEGKWKMDFMPFPGEVFAEDARIQCIGIDVKDHRGNVIGEVIDYKIVDGNLIMTFEQKG